MPNLIPIEKTVKYTVYGRYCAKDFSKKKYCQFVRLTHFGHRAKCALYEQKLYQDSENGYLIERCQQCLNDWE